jgi:hypothetical protein
VTGVAAGAAGFTASAVWRSLTVVWIAVRRLLGAEEQSAPTRDELLERGRGDQHRQRRQAQDGGRRDAELGGEAALEARQAGGGHGRGRVGRAGAPGRGEQEIARGIDPRQGDGGGDEAEHVGHGAS